jgi:hypothetical protein
MVKGGPSRRPPAVNLGEDSPPAAISRLEVVPNRTGDPPRLTSPFTRPQGRVVTEWVKELCRDTLSRKSRRRFTGFPFRLGLRNPA